MDVDNGKFDYKKSATDTDFGKGKEYEYVAVDLGKKKIKDLDLTGISIDPTWKEIPSQKNW